MKIYTSYFANLKKLPKDIVPISICGRAPDWYTGIQYKVLAPKFGFFQQWKLGHDTQYYKDHFYSEVLDKLNVGEVIKSLFNMSEGKDVALTCYEKPTDFCHRHLVAEWLNDNGYDCEEFNEELYRESEKSDLEGE